MTGEFVCRRSPKPNETTDPGAASSIAERERACETSVQRANS